MATTITGFLHAFPFSNLDTYNYTIKAAGNHAVAVKCTDAVSLNGLSVVIQKNSSPIASSSNTTAAGPNELNLYVLNNCAVNDVISVVVTSSKASDAGPNQIKGYITITMNV